jgi:hypothetical protein
MHPRHALYAGLAALLFLMLTGTAAATPIIYIARVDTSTLAGPTGYLSFSLNGGGDAAIVTIGGFTSDGTLLGVDTATSSGAYSGALPGTVTLDDTSGDVAFLQGFTLGNFMQFLVSFSGPALSSPAGAMFGNTFSFALYDGSGNIIGPTDDFGNTFTVDVNADGSTTPYTSSIVTLGEVPEPSSALLIGLGVAAFAIRRLRPVRQS